MKKAIIATLFLFVSVGAFAQFEKGTMLVSGTGSFYSGKEKFRQGSITVIDNKFTKVSLLPSFGYFVINNLAVGGMIRLGSESRTFLPSNDKVTYTSFGIGPFARYYIGNTGLFGHFDILVGSSKDKDVQNNVVTQRNYGLTEWDLGVGYDLLLGESKRFGIEGLLTYGAQGASLKGANPSEKTIDGGVNLKIGLVVFLGK